MSCVLTHFSRSVVFHKETFEMKWFCRSFDWLLYEMNRPWLETIISFVLNNSMAISCLLLRKKCFFHVIILASLMLLSSGKFVEFFFDIHAVNVISADLMDLRQTFSVCICTFFTCKLPQFPQFVSGSYSSMPHSLILLGEKELKRVSLTLSAWNLAHM